MNRIGNNCCDIKRRPNMSHNDYDINNVIIKPIENFFQEHKKYLNENSDNNFDSNNVNYSCPIPISIQRIIESKTFSIKEFSISEKKIQRKNAFILLRMLGKRISQSKGLQITSYNDRYYKEGCAIFFLKMKNRFGEINLMKLLFVVKLEEIFLYLKLMKVIM